MFDNANLGAHSVSLARVWESSCRSLNNLVTPCSNLLTWYDAPSTTVVVKLC